jgi:hypothetical protein
MKIFQWSKLKACLMLFVAAGVMYSCNLDTLTDDLQQADLQAEQVLENTDIKNANMRVGGVTVCHKGAGDIIIDEAALATHIAHGDAVDRDGDGFFHIDNPCSETDLDDTIPFDQSTLIDADGDGYFTTVNPFSDVDCDDEIAFDQSTLVDEDNDGFFNIDNPCSETDCDDTTYSENNSCCATNIGDLREGGVVFWIDPNDNTKGLVFYTEDAPNKLNWHDAMAYCAALEAGTYNDWYLPSKVEINLMKIGNACLGNIGGFETFFYWSSTDDNSTFFAWGQYFPIGGYGYGFKSGAYNVRAVRAF